MHELGVTLEIVAIAREAAGPYRVRRVVLEIGKLTAISPEAIRFCFDLCTAGSNLEAAMLEIVEIPGRARCLECHGVMTLDIPCGRCRCGSAALEWLSGEELRVKELEVAGHV